MHRPVTWLHMVVIAAFVVFVTGSGVVLAHGGDASAIHGCIDKVGKALRILAAPGVGDPSAACKPGEIAIDWNAAGGAGPTSAERGDTEVITDGPTVLISHAVTAEEAGLNIAIASVKTFDRDTAAGDSSAFSCQLSGFPGVVEGDNLVLYDTGETGLPGFLHRDKSATTLIARGMLEEGDVVYVVCQAVAGDGSEASGNATLLLERVSS